MGTSQSPDTGDDEYADSVDDGDLDPTFDSEDDEDVFLKRRIRRDRNGTFAINLPDEERELLTELPAQLRELLAEGDASSLRRLFPAAYHLDAEKDAEYHRLVREELVANRVARAEVLESTAHATVLTEEQLLSWMGAINDLRLVLGTQLDVSEDDEPVDADDPRAGHYGLYHYLGFLLENVLRALNAG